MVRTTTSQKESMLQMFTDNTSGEVYADGRLETIETDSGNVALVAYGWLKLAEYNERREAVTVFTGHKSLRSRIVTRYLNDVISVSQERREVILSGESPTVGRPNEGAKYIGAYVDFSSKLSSVEQKAVNTVVESIKLLN